MTRTIFLVLTAILGSKALATTQVLFTDDKAVVVLQGQPGDLDAPGLFNVMNIPSVDDGTTLKKHFSFTNSAKQNVFDLTCSLSKTVENYGSCTLQIFKIEGMVFEPSEKKVIVAIQDMADAVKVSKLFARPDQYGLIYFSADRNLGFSAPYDGGSYPELFMIQYSATHP